MRKISAVSLVLALGLGVSGAQGQNHDRTVRVGVFPIDPIVSMAPGENPKGLFVDLVTEVARLENWRLVFVPGTWNDGLKRLEEGRIDLMTGVAFVGSRLDRMQFGSETVLTVWGQVFSLPGNEPLTILDLKDKRLALATGDINGVNFRAAADKFGVTCRYLEAPTHEDIFRLIQRGDVDAGIAPNVFGIAHAADFGVVGTAIIFSPLESRFAAPKNADGSLLRAIDTHLKTWKSQEGSFYYQRLERWLGSRETPSKAIPLWMPALVVLVVLMALFLFLANRVLKRKYRAQTEELRASQTKLRAIFDQSYQFIGLLNPEGILLDVNQTALDFIGAPASEVVGKPFWEAPWWSHSVLAQEKIQRGIQLAAQGKIFKSEATHPAVDGSLHTIEFSVKGIKDDTGKVRWLIPEGRDVTEYKETREQLARLGQAIEQTPEMVVITDAVGTVEYVNPACVQVTGYENGEFLGRTLAFLDPGDQVDGLYSESWFRRLADHTWRGRASNVKKDGTTFVVDASVSPILDQQGGLLAYVVLQRDMSQVEELERNLRVAQRMEAVGTLAAGIAHDFNNILAAIFGFTELAQLVLGEDSPATEYLDEVIVGAERARTLVRQILVFGRRSAQEWQSIELTSLIREVLTLVRHSFPSTISVIEDLQADGFVMGDPGQIHQVLMNLCTNAFQALEDRGGVLTVALRRQQVRADVSDMVNPLPPGGYLVVEVKDNGPGIDPSLLDKIFEPYFTTKGPGKGTGLGLSVVHGLVQAHHGKIEVTSRPGKGATFRVWLPEFIEGVNLGPGDVDVYGKHGRGEHILFVDDEEVLGRLAKHFFTDLGYRITTFIASQEAWEAFKADPDHYDLVISDQTMPGMTGVDLAAQILALKPSCPFILCSGYSAEVTRESVSALGISRIVQKPVEMEKLGLIVRGILDRRVEQGH